jgi:hypothetical protein
VPLLWVGCTGRLAPCRYCGSTVPDGSRRAAFVPNRRGTRHADGYGVLRLVGALDFLGAPSFANDRRNRTARAVPLLCLVPDGSRRAAFVPNRRGTRHADGYGVLRLVGALDFLGAPSFANDRRNRTARAVPLLYEGRHRTARAVPLLLDWIRGDAAQCRRTAGQVELMRFVIVIGA